MKHLIIFAILCACLLAVEVAAKAVKSSSSEEDRSNESNSSEEVLTLPQVPGDDAVATDSVRAADAGDTGVAADAAIPIRRLRRSIADLVDDDDCTSDITDEPEYVYAKAEILPNNALSRENRKTKGAVFLRQRASSQGVYRKTEFKISIEGLAPETSHGFHIHQFGTIGASCTQAGGHYNPFDDNHGAPSARARHVGDLGNVLADENGHVSLTYSDTKALLYSLSTIVGRAFVVHEGMDDLGLNDDRGSRTTGNAGGRLACGVIVWSNGEGWRGPQP